MQKYTCPMHPEVITDHPGNCPKCGMKLVPIKEKKRRTPINREQAPNESRSGAQRPTPSQTIDSTMEPRCAMSIASRRHEMHTPSHEGQMQMEMRCIPPSILLIR